MDLIASDRTGSGKTLSYILPLTERLRDQGFFSMKIRRPLLLVILPTRELCLQVNKEFETFCQHNEYKNMAIYGGTSV